MLVERVRKIVDDWAIEEGWSETPRCDLERPADASHGDYATPLCMQLVKAAKRSPKVLAEDLRSRLLGDAELAVLIEKLEIAGPGFLNFTLSPKAYVQVMNRLLSEGERIGAGETRAHPRLNLEFVSVNPNGPLHVGHGRYAAYGDALARLLIFSGANLSTEFYINDYGRQMDRFGKSVAARYAQSFGVELASTRRRIPGRLRKGRRRRGPRGRRGHMAGHLEGGGRGSRTGEEPGRRADNLPCRR